MSNGLGLLTINRSVKSCMRDVKHDMIRAEDGSDKRAVRGACSMFPCADVMSRCCWASTYLQVRCAGCTRCCVYCVKGNKQTSSCQMSLHSRDDGKKG